MLRLDKVRIAPGFWILLLFSFAAGAQKVLPLVALSALLHELGHLAALRLFGVNVTGFDLTAFGAEIHADTRYLSYVKDILCTLAGPLVNLLLGWLLARTSGDYLFAGANLLQGGFNLLPVAGLDGARALHLLISWIFDPETADRICRMVELVCAGSFCIAALYLVIWRHGGLFLLLAALGLLRSTLAVWWVK